VKAAHARTVAAVILFFLICATAWGQQSTPSVADAATPAPYSPEEFPGWALDLRRGEIITLGVFPLALFFTNFGYQVYRFGQKSIEAGSFNMDYAPGLFSPGGTQPLTESERIGVVLGSLGVSVIVALIDYALGKRETRNTKK